MKPIHKKIITPADLSSEKFRSVFRDRRDLVDTQDGIFLPLPVSFLNPLFIWYAGQFGISGTFVDAGSGDNRVLIAAAAHGFNHRIGIESDSFIFERGRKSLRAYFENAIPATIETKNADFTSLSSYHCFLDTITTIYHFINAESLQKLVLLLATEFPSSVRLLLMHTGTFEIPPLIRIKSETYCMYGMEIYATVYQHPSFSRETDQKI